MKEHFGSFCAFARKAAGFSQESAAELLGTSSRSISNYESGKAPVPDDIAAQMAKNYDALWLGYLYLSMSTDVGEMILPKIEVRELSLSLLNLQVHMKRAFDIQYEFAEIGSGNIDVDQQQLVYAKCVSVLNTLIGAAFAVVIAPKKAALALTSTAIR